MKPDDFKKANIGNRVRFQPLERDDADYAEGTITDIERSLNRYCVMWDDGHHTLGLVLDADYDRIHLMTDDELGISWWNGLMPTERATWSSVAGNTGIVKDAWEAFKKAKT